MNIEAYIASGILEQYVLGQLLADDAAEVERMAASYPEIRQELDSIEQGFEAYAFKLAVAPRPELKSKIKSQLTFNTQESIGVSEPIIKETKVRSINSFTQYLVAASVMLAVVSSGFAYYFFTQWKKTEANLAGLQQQYAQVAQNVEQVNYKLKQQESDLHLFHEVVSNPEMKLISMAGVKDKSYQAHVYWNKGTQEVYLNVQNMPELPKGKQYQLWALKDGQPIDAGVFEITEELRLQHMKNIDGAQAFAVTIEPEGGSPAPTLSTLCVMGNI